MSEGERIEKEKRRSKIITIFLLIILVGSTAAYAFVFYDGESDKDDSLKGNINYIIANNEKVYLNHELENVKNISVSINSDISAFANKVLYIDSESEMVISEIAYTLGRYTKSVQDACYGSCEKDLPEKDCGEELIVFKKSDENRVYQQEKCIFIEGDLRAVDAFIYRIFEQSKA